MNTLTRTTLHCGYLAPLLLISATIVLATQASDYSHLRDFISELAATGFARAEWMRAAFIASGLLMLSFALALPHALPQKPGWLPRLLLIGYALTSIGTGIFSCDLSCNPPPELRSEQQNLHDLFGISAMLIMFIQQIIWGRLFKRINTTQFRQLAYFSYCCCALGIAGFIGIATIGETYEVGGLMQRIVILSSHGWLAVIAISTLSGPKAST